MLTFLSETHFTHRFDEIRKGGTSRCANITSKWVLVWNKSSVLLSLPPPVNKASGRHKRSHTAQMWVLVSEACKWRKINYQGSESISHGFSITLRTVAMKQLQLWNMVLRGWTNLEPVCGFISMTCPWHKLNFSMMVFDSICLLLCRASRPSGERQREEQEVAENLPQG